MPYNFNPHRHVKIWLSKDKDVFLNLENQIRLVKMRDINPDDEINLIYDGHLLSPKALEDLNAFCTRYNIVPKNIHTDVFPLCQTDKERQLIEIYKDEMAHLDKGGNVAVGSDILRWLKPVYELGTYSDFDVHVDTSTLPKTISVEKPILLNIGSSIFNIHTDTILINNDRIAVVHSEDALAHIEKIQQAICDNCSKQQSSGTNFIEQYLTNSEKQLSQIIKPQDAALQMILDPNYKILRKLEKLSRGKTQREVRKEIIDSTANNLTFSKLTLTDKEKSFSGLSDKIIISEAAELLIDTNFMAQIFSAPKKRNSSIKPLSPQEKVTKARKEYRMAMLKNSVIQTSGPGAVQSLFKLYYDKERIDVEVAPFSFSKYDLTNAFNSENSAPLHVTQNDLNSKLQVSEIGKCNDLSWLEEGQNAIANREQTIRKVQSLAHTLPKRISAHITKIENQLQGCFSFYRNRERYAKINALKEILAQFKENGFNALEFSQQIQNYRSKDIFASIGKSKTKELIDEIMHFTQLALDNNITTKNGIVIVVIPDSEKQYTHMKSGPAV
ncbi:MAG: glycosyltransferase family 88 protein [Legionella sp.]|nr:glycosyltransferase family 88 protein [Legionella sp.]